MQRLELVVVVAILALPAVATAAEAPRFVVDVHLSGGDVLLFIDICGYAGRVEVVGLDIGDPETTPLVLEERTRPRACGDGWVLDRVITAGILDPPVHCYWLRASVDGPVPAQAHDLSCG